MHTDKVKNTLACGKLMIKCIIIKIIEDHHNYPVITRQITYRSILYYNVLGFLNHLRNILT